MQCDVNSLTIHCCMIGSRLSGSRFG